MPPADPRPSWTRVELTEIGWEEPLRVSRGGSLPSPGAQDVLVEVEACGVCHRDLLDREGRFPFLQPPVVPGHEAVGRVIAVGEDVTAWAPGDRVATLHRDYCGDCASCARGDTSLCEGAAHVFGILADGGYASHLIAPERALYRMPEALEAKHAAVMHCTFGTAWRGLVVAAGLQEGERALITGANGGVGAAAIQIAKRKGAHVTAVVRADRFASALRELGADDVQVHPDAAFHKSIEPVDVALECVGTPTFNASLRTLRLGGRLAVVGNVTEERASINLGQLVVKGISVLGPGGATAHDMASVLRLHEERPFSFLLHQELDLQRADEAQRTVRSGGLLGRIVLLVGDPKAQT